MSSNRHWMRKTLISLAILIVLASLAACAANQAADEDEGANLASQSQALSGDDGAGSEGADGLGPVAIACPEDQVYKLQFNHTWEFKPAGQGELMTVTGHTSSNAWCLISSSGTKVVAEDCLIDYEYSGFMQTSDGKCDIQGASDALISFEGECLQPTTGGDDLAEIYLTIMEGPNPDADLSGALNCKDYSGPYIGFYPPSHSTMNFLIKDGGATQTDNIDLTGQFDFTKSWTLIPAGLSTSP